MGKEQMLPDDRDSQLRELKRLTESTLRFADRLLGQLNVAIDLLAFQLNIPHEEAKKLVEDEFRSRSGT